MRKGLPPCSGRLRAAVTGPPPSQGGGFVTKEKRGKKRGEKGKTKHTGAKQ
ncbi:hypothetical protein KI387_014572, partial [Taxus chinensis]